MNGFRLAVMFAALALLAGCAPKTGDGVDAAKGFGVRVGFKAVEMCQNVSPEMHIDNIPPETKKLNVKVLNFEFGSEIFNQDFGFTTTNTGLYINGAQAMVPKGSMYGPAQMPCPKEKPSQVQVQVKALDARDRELAKISVTHSVDPAP
ncbi:hypothetical protein [Fundidesulfovibrio agrisoli]|uniref:hypothetical protein n=1 Tax=Fundidesulfovibrio agrisoli TaxID=2922717 RepID=UPI001FAC6C93|nr:hypothetical protein [Fundidesulfovibrio agrisoli]